MPIYSKSPLRRSLQKTKMVVQSICRPRRTVRDDHFEHFVLRTFELGDHYALILHDMEGLWCNVEISFFAWTARRRHQRMLNRLKRSITAPRSAALWMEYEPTWYTPHVGILDLETVPPKTATLLKLRYG